MRPASWPSSSHSRASAWNVLLQVACLFSILARSWPRPFAANQDLASDLGYQLGARRMTEAGVRRLFGAVGAGLRASVCVCVPIGSSSSSTVQYNHSCPLCAPLSHAQLPVWECLGTEFLLYSGWVIVRVIVAISQIKKSYVSK